MERSALKTRENEVMTFFTRDHNRPFANLAMQPSKHTYVSSWPNEELVREQFDAMDHMEDEEYDQMDSF